MNSRSSRIRKTVRDQTEPSIASPEPVMATMIMGGEALNLVEIRATGDVLLDVAFENQKSNARLPSPQPGNPKPSILLRNTKTANVRFLYRVKLDTLKRTSRYFDMLLANETFSEGRKIAETFRGLESRGIVPAEAAASDLPRISITDDDETTRIAGRESAFGDLLRILHGGEINSRSSIPYLAVLSTLADRFDCTATVARFVKASKKVPWPQTYGTVTIAVEEVIRQKVLISWLLDDQIKFAAATKELILRGSTRWVTEEAVGKDQQAIWWDLQDGLEGELHFRRSCILNTLSSLQKHFVDVYSSKTRQCKHFYDSSAACDSFQLGEIVKFFMSKKLLSLTSPLAANFEDYSEEYGSDIETLITIMRQCPAYQIDQNHNHCGMRSRILPALDFITGMLTSNIGIDRKCWKTDRPTACWEDNGAGQPFKFTKGIAGDQRLKVDGLIVGNRHAKAFFTASSWDWSPDEVDRQASHLGRAFGSITGF